MGNTTVRPDAMLALTREEDTLCVTTLDTQGKTTRQCTDVRDLGDGTCERVDIGDGYYAETCYSRSNVQSVGTVQSLSTFGTTNNIPVNNNSVWQVQNGNNRPVTLSETDISMLNSNNGSRRNGNLRIEPLNNGGISIRFD